MYAIPIVILGFVLPFVSLTACVTTRPPSPPAEAPSSPDAVALPLHHQFLTHPSDDGKRIEVYWMKPEGVGPWPAILALHGHQEPDRPGAADWTHGWMQRMAARGYFAIAMSQPGYGQTDGPPDYCGPFTQQAVEQVLRFLRQNDQIRPERIGIYGVSRGAVVAAMVATRETSLAALVLDVGFYDLRSSFDAFRSSSEPMYRGIADNIAKEAGVSDEAMRQRSALLYVDRIKTPTLVITSEFDHPCSESQARELTEALIKRGVPAKLVDFGKQGHEIPFKLRNGEIDPFLAEHLLPQSR